MTEQKTGDTDILVRFKWNCGRQGVVEGLFITTQKKLTESYGKHVYFGEILGKHSEVYGTLDEGDIKVITEDQEFIAKLIQYVGRDISGYNPFSYMRDEDEE